MELILVIIYMKAHELLFCSALELKTWYELEVGEVKVVMKEEDVV